MKVCGFILLILSFFSLPVGAQSHLFSWLTDVFSPPSLSLMETFSPAPNTRSNDGQYSDSGQLANAPCAEPSPAGLTADRFGHIILFNSAAKAIQFLDSKGQLVDEWSTEMFGRNLVNQSTRISTGWDGSVYVADRENQLIRVFDKDGQYHHSCHLRTFNGRDYANPVGLSVDHRGYVYVADDRNYVIQVFNRNGDFVRKISFPLSAHGDVFTPSDVVVNSLDQIIVADRGDHTLKVFNRYGQMQTMWDVEPAPQNPETVVRYQLAVMSDDTVILANSHDSAIRTYDRTGKLKSAWKMPGDETDVANLGSIAVDQYDRLYMSEAYSSSVRIYSFTPSSPAMDTQLMAGNP